jgi:hypothetical protein
MASDFTSRVPGSAFWRRGTSNECRATGRAVLSDFRAGLLWEERAEMSADEDTQVVNESAEEGARVGWSRASLHALASLCTRYGHGSYALAVMRNANEGGAITPMTMRAILWCAYSRVARTDGSNTHNESPASYTIPSDAILPTVGSVPPLPLDGIVSGASCTLTRSPSGSGGDRPVQTVSSVNPLLVIALLAAVAVAGSAAMSIARKKHGNRW